MGLSPALPTDLEREIFEFVAFSNIRSVPGLVLVAQRVNKQIEPLLYRNLSVYQTHSSQPDDDVNLIRISTSDFLRLLHSKPASFFHDHVRHLALMRVPSSAAALILSRCSGALRLALFQPGTPDSNSWLPSIAAMSLVQISVDVNPLFGNSGVDFRHDSFARLAHLDLFEIPTSESWATDLCQLPCLTHLSFNFDWEDYAEANIDATSCRLILTGCKSLNVLVLVFMDESGREEFDCKYFSNDPRSVTMVVADFLGDWERGATGGADYWIRAASFIQKRRSGEIKGLV
ncbi:hypothetical protein C8R45DRAFT_850381 [Mycena sanguinolenta]|nr:hypothetical protein C8R45DRAFT_850381 [Mycena sanguinolenta]